MLKATVTKIGNSLGLVLPKAAIVKLKVHKGDKIYLCETQEGYNITPYDKAFVKQMEHAEKIMHEDRDVLKVLADS